MGNIKPPVKQSGINSTHKRPEHREKRQKLTHYKQRTIPELMSSNSDSVSVSSNNDSVQDSVSEPNSPSVDTSIDAIINNTDEDIDLDALQRILSAPGNEPKWRMDRDQKIHPESVVKHINPRLYTNQLTFSQATHYKGCMDCQLLVPVLDNKPLFRREKWSKGFTATHTNNVDTKAVSVRETPVGFMKESALCFKNSFH